MSLRDESIALMCAVEPWPYSEVDTRHAIELHPDGPVAHQVARVEARLSDLLRRQREACAGEMANLIGVGAAFALERAKNVDDDKAVMLRRVLAAEVK